MEKGVTERETGCGDEGRLRRRRRIEEAVCKAGERRAAGVYEREKEAEGIERYSSGPEGAFHVYIPVYYMQGCVVKSDSIPRDFNQSLRRILAAAAYY